MKVLIIGSGGREHSLLDKLSQSNRISELFVFPGNGGTKKYSPSLIENSNQGILNYCKNNIDLVVIGPEGYLVNGLSDLLKENGIAVFGPSKEAARIESEKTFAKNLMKKYSIPTADFKIFSISDKVKVIEHLKEILYPRVIKADGLAAGKGVLIVKNLDEALTAIEIFFEEKKFGNAGEKIVIEEFMEGDEASVFAITDGEEFVILPPAQDHKKIGENDTGENTGGMGAYSPTKLISNELESEISEKIIYPTLKAMKNEGIPFTGCLYCGLMITDEGPKVVEFNCRFGDPETQSVLQVIDGDFFELLYSTAKGKLNKDAVFYNGGVSVTVVAASKGYPDKFEKGIVINGLDNEFENVKIFHAGTAVKNDSIITSGGRVLNICSFNKDGNLQKAINDAYTALSQINFENIYYRKDIAAKGLKYLATVKQ